MSSWRAIAWRNALIALVSIALFAAAALARPTVRGTAGRILRATHEVLGPALAAQCEASPETFGIDRPDLRIFAYDPETFLSANPAAPPPSPALLALWRSGDPDPLLLFLPDGTGGGAIVRNAASGPCGAAEVRWPQPGRQRSRTATALLVLASITVAGGTALATSLTVRPIARRLDALRAAAARIGTPEYVAPTAEPGQPLDQLAEVVDQAHRRAMAARDEESARRAALEELLDDVAHDLRTPIAALQLRLEAAAAEADPGLREQINGALGDVTYLTQLTANLRAGATLRAASPHASADLRAVLSRVVERFAVIGRHAGVEVVCALPEAPVLVACDEALAEQALANLVHNAVRHNRPGGHVSALLSLDASSFCVEIADDGPGVPDAQLQAMNAASLAPDPAEGAPARASSAHLGLLITRAVCRRSGWTLTLASLDPSGLAATIRGPLRRVHGASTSAA